MRGALAAGRKAGAGCAIVLEATHEATLKIVPFELLIQYAVIPDQLLIWLVGQPGRQRNDESDGPKQ